MQKLLKGVGIFVVAVALLAGVAAPTADALTQSEADAIIAALGLTGSTADVINALVTGGSSSSSSCALASAPDLTIGSTGASVVDLQNYLVSGGYLVMPAGVSMGYFGSLTQSALASYQAAMGIAPAAGYFGPITKASVTCSTETETETETSTGSTSGLQGGDGDFKSFDEIGSIGSESLEEGDTETVFGFEFEADDSDLSIQRVKLTLEGDSDEKPWRFLDEIVLNYNGDEIASIDASDEDEYDEDTNDVYEFSFSGLDAVVEEGDDAEFTVDVTANDDIDDSDLDIVWTIDLVSDGVRAINAEGVNVYEDSADSTTFTLTTVDASSLDATFRSNDNEDESVEVADNKSETEDVLLYTFEIEASDGDVMIEDIVVTLATTSGSNSVEDIIESVVLVIDGEEVATESGDTTVNFDDIDFDVNEDDELVVEIFAVVEGTDDGDQFDSGDGVEVTGVDIDYVDDQDDDQDETDLLSQAGGDITFYTEGITVVLEEVSAVKDEASFSGDNDTAVFEITFEVVAFGDEDIFIGGANTVTSANAGVTYTISSSTAANVTLAELITDAEEGENDNYVVTDSEMFTFRVEIEDASTTASDVAQKLTITGIKWDTTDADSSPDETYDDNLDDFKTKSLTI
jgi:hypothetical protein